MLLGAWRHLGSVASYGRCHDGPALLARLTGVPVVVWTGLFLLVRLGCVS